MKKVLLIITTLAIVFISCENNSVKNQNNENGGPQYFTVIYHSRGHTSGEPPVDNNKYLPGELITVLGPGTLEKEGYYLCWWPIDKEYGFDVPIPSSPPLYLPGAYLNIMGDLIMHAIWLPLNQ